MEEVETRHGNWRTRSSSDRSLFRTFAKHGWTPSSLWCLDSHAFLPAIMALLQMMGRAPAATARMFHFAKWWSWATYIHSRYPPADNTVALRPKHKERALESWLRQILTRLVEWRSSSVFSPRTILSRYGAKWVPWFRPPQALPARLTFGSTRSRSHISKRPPISFPRSRLSDGC